MLRADPVGPRITYYDDATGERIELSGVTLANWAAKTGNLLRDELGAGPASRIVILLPAHWQTAAVLFGVWWIGAEAVLPETEGAPADIEADIALCTAERLDEADTAVSGGEVAVLSLDPFGRPAADLPVGVTDYATAVRVHGDQIVPERRPGPALAGRSTEEILADCENSAAARGLTSKDRVLSSASWPGPGELVDGLLAIMAHGAFEGKDAHHPDIRRLFTLESLRASDWYRERLAAKQRVDDRLWRRHVAALDAVDTSGEQRRRWRQPGTVAVQTDPPGARVTIERFDAGAGGRLPAVPVASSLTTPVPNVFTQTDTGSG